MKCTCGCEMKIRPGGGQGGRDSFAKSMNTPERFRICRCGRTMKTYEVAASELAELRRKAHLFVMSGVHA
jgi:hypothetical protein